MNLAMSLKSRNAGSEPTHESQAHIHMLIVMTLAVFQRHQMKR